MNLTPPSSNILKDDSNINSNPVSELTFDSFWDTLGFKELHFILSVLINACDQVKEGDLKSKLKDALYFIAGVRTNSYGNSDRYRHTRVLFHDTTMDDTTINILCENMESNKYDDLLPTATNQSDYLNTVNSNIPMNMTHLLQLFVFNSNEADSLFLHGRMEYFFQFQRIKCAIPILLANIDYTNAYMMNLCREEFPNFINAFSDFVDPSHTRILYDDISVSSDTTRPNNNLQPIKGAAKYLNFHARLNPDEFLKKKYRWIKRFLDWIDLFSMDIYDNYDFDQDKYKPKRRAASVKWTKKDFGISCEFFKVQDQFLFALSDEQPLDSHLRFYLENHQSALDNVITWQENNSFVFKVTLRLCLSSYLPFLNDSTW